MATIKQYTVRRASWAKSKQTGKPVHITRGNEADIPLLLTKADIHERVKSGALIEYDTGVEEPDLEAARALEAEAGVDVVPDPAATRQPSARSRRGNRE